MPRLLGFARNGADRGDRHIRAQGIRGLRRNPYGRNRSERMTTSCLFMFAVRFLTACQLANRATNSAGSTGSPLKSACMKSQPSSNSRAAAASF